ncbi:MAG: zinc-ribbon domain-containing protein [Lachnospiraceae bacterium]|nr:zinc-ribbon domain-containing protein [Lachnospiraceae bacterium]
MFCEKCGAELRDGVKFCEECGAKVIKTEMPQENTIREDRTERPKQPQAPYRQDPPVNNAPVPQEKSKSGCCLAAAIVGIIVFLLVVAFIVAVLVVGFRTVTDFFGPSNLGQSYVTNTPTSAAVPVSTYTPTPKAGSEDTAAVVNNMFGTDIVRDHKVKLKGNGEDTVTVMVYMNGSDLETESGEATTDLAEMVRAGASDKVNVVVQTMGTKRWQNYNISSKRSQIHEITKNGLKTVKELSQLDCTKESTLSDFIIWTAQNYPADRYVLVFWDHGGGPVYGFGYDEYNESGMLTIDEIKGALKTAGVYFDFIGMDCCIMSCLEVCCACYDYCDYMILSEDFESGLGWSYTGWLSELYKNTSIPTEKLGKIIVDDMVNANKNDRTVNEEAILALIDESMMKLLFTAWTDFAYANEETLLDNNYSRHIESHGKVSPFIKAKGFFSDWLLSGSEEYSLDDYYITDIMALAQTIDSTESAALASAVSNTMIYVNATSGDAEMTGLSVTLPYGDLSFYLDLKRIFLNCGFDEAYVTWLKKFTDASDYNSFYDYREFDDSWSGWDDYSDDYNWNDWDYYDEYGDDYDWGSWFDLFGWDDWDYDDSWNEWFDDGDWYNEDDRWNYNDDDWYWGDDYWYGDDWYWGF